MSEAPGDANERVLDEVFGELSVSRQKQSEPERSRCVLGVEILQPGLFRPGQGCRFISVRSDAHTIKTSESPSTRRLSEDRFLVGLFE